MTVRQSDLEGALTLLDQVMASVNIGRGSYTATYGHRVSGGSQEHAPLPVDVDLIDKKVAAHRMLMDRALRIAMETGAALTGRDPHGLTNYLYTRAAWIVAQLWGDQFHRDLLAHTEGLDGARDQQAPKILLGPCTTTGCETNLEGREGDTEVRCHACGYEYSIIHLRHQRVTQALGHDGTPLRAAQAVRYLNNKGLTITTKDVENWVKWGHLTPADHDDKGRRLYNLQDIYTRAARNNT
jgi:hypothetical protein